MGECACLSGLWTDLGDGVEIGFEASRDGMLVAVRSNGAETWFGPVRFCPLCGRRFG